MHIIDMLAITSILSGIGATNHAPSPRRLAIENATAAQVAAVDAAAQRFTDANLALPELTIRFGDDSIDCYGHPGIFDAATTPWTITICSDLAFVVTHELAHAWLDSNLDAQTRAQYLRLRQKTNWDDKQAGWSDRGAKTPPCHPTEPDDLTTATAERGMAEASRRLRATYRPHRSSPRRLKVIPI